ncbi:MAG: integrase core domain-containing protein [Akkermansiaceae bacterium]
MSAAHRRELARQAVAAEGCSQRQVCRVFRLHRSTYRYRTKTPSLSKQLVDQSIVELSREHAELGADKIGRLVRNEGLRVSNDRVREVRREEGWTVPPPKKKRRRAGQSTGRHPQKASYRGHVWSWDFIYDWTLKGGAFRVLSVVDEYTRETHALHVDRHIGAKKVREVMTQLIRQHGAPRYIRSDNGPEPERSGDSRPKAARRASVARQFVAILLRDWLEDEKIKTLYIDPGSPWQNGYVEPSGARWTGAKGDVLRRSATGREYQSFHDKFRRECLGRNMFYTLGESRVVIGDWRQKFNHVRPHRSLGMRTPKEFTAELPPRKRRAA